MLNIFANKKTGTNKELATEEYVDNKMEYSTDEIVIGKWVDGKPIYRKVIETTKANINPILTSLNIRRYVSFWGMARAIYNNTWPIPNLFRSEAGYDITFMGGDNFNNVTIVFGAYYNDNSPVKVIVEYTKTTD